MLNIRDLHVKFRNRDREAVAGVSLSIGEGEIVGLVGESGSGKTVTAMSVAGLLPRKQCAYSGEILLDGAELLHADRKDLRKIQGKDIGVVFQEPQSALDPLMKIGPQVEEVLRVHTDLNRAERRRAALEALAAVELPEAEAVYGKYPHQLSGGRRAHHRPGCDHPGADPGAAEKAEPGVRGVHALHLPQPERGAEALRPGGGDAAGGAGGGGGGPGGLPPSEAPLHPAAHRRHSHEKTEGG